MAYPSIIQSNTEAGSSTSGYSVSLWSNPTSGNLIIAACNVRGNTSISSFPDGFNHITDIDGNTNGGASSPRLWVGYKFSDGTEGTNFGFYSADVTQGQVAVAEVLNVQSVAASGSEASITGLVSTITIPDITTTAEEQMVFSVIGTRSDSVGSTIGISPPSEYNEVKTKAVNNGMCVGMAKNEVASPSLQTGDDWTTSYTTRYQQAYMVLSPTIATAISGVLNVASGINSTAHSITPFKTNISYATLNSASATSQIFGLEFSSQLNSSFYQFEYDAGDHYVDNTWTKAQIQSALDSNKNVYFKRGDEFPYSFSINVANKEIGYYGTGPRPLIRPPQGQNGFTINTDGFTKLVIAGLEIDGRWNGQDNNFSNVDRRGISFARNLDNSNKASTGILIEDCKISFFDSNIHMDDRHPRIILDATQYGRISFIVNRCILGPSNSTDSHAINIYCEGTDGNCIINETVLNKSGWVSSRDEARPDGQSGANANKKEHNIYSQSYGGPITVTNCWVFNAAAHGIQFRSGGTLKKSVFVRCPMQAWFGGYTSLAEDNVCFDQVDISNYSGSEARGRGFECHTMWDGWGGRPDLGASATFKRNLFYRRNGSFTNEYAIGGGSRRVVMEDNYANRWEIPSNSNNKVPDTAFVIHDVSQDGLNGNVSLDVDDSSWPSYSDANLESILMSREVGTWNESIHNTENFITQAKQSAGMIASTTLDIDFDSNISDYAPIIHSGCANFSTVNFGPGTYPISYVSISGTCTLNGNNTLFQVIQNSVDRTNASHMPFTLWGSGTVLNNIDVNCAGSYAAINVREDGCVLNNCSVYDYQHIGIRTDVRLNPNATFIANGCYASTERGENNPNLFRDFDTNPHPFQTDATPGGSNMARVEYNDCVSGPHLYGGTSAGVFIKVALCDNLYVRGYRVQPNSYVSGSMASFVFGEDVKNFTFEDCIFPRGITQFNDPLAKDGHILQGTVKDCQIISDDRVHTWDHYLVSGLLMTNTVISGIDRSGFNSEVEGTATHDFIDCTFHTSRTSSTAGFEPQLYFANTGVTTTVFTHSGVVFVGPNENGFRISSQQPIVDAWNGSAQEPDNPFVAKGVYLKYNFNNNLLDSSGRGNNGTLLSNTSYVTSRRNNGLQLTKTKGATIPSGLDFTVHQSGGLAISTWIKTSSVSGINTIIRARNASSGASEEGWSLYSIDDGVYFSVSDGTTQAVVSGIGLFTGEWHHIVAELELGSNSMGFCLDEDRYIDTTPIEGPISAIGKIENNNPIQIGGFGEQEVSIIIDQLEIRDQLFSSNDKEDLFDKGLIKSNRAVGKFIGKSINRGIS